MQRAARRLAPSDRSIVRVPSMVNVDKVWGVGVGRGGELGVRGVAVRSFYVAGGRGGCGQVRSLDRLYSRARAAVSK